jgi:hypothetical protein
MIDFTLKITQMDNLRTYSDMSNVVTRVYWAYTGNDGVNSFGMGGSTVLPLPASNSGFTSYADLTENQVAEWVLHTWTAEEKDSYENTITSRFDNITNAIPWSDDTIHNPPPAPPADPPRMKDPDRT